jgi:type I restriction enzyme S subunit
MDVAPLESVCTRISSGGTPSRKESLYFSSDQKGHPWVKSKELLDRAIEDTEEHITDLGLAKSSAKYFPERSVLIAMYGANVGQLGWLRRPATVNQAICGLVVDESKADWRFIFYSLLMNRGDLTVQAQGAAQQNLNQDLIRQFCVSLPALPVQKRIAAILSAYDELIENSQRRIKILESMARALYREWFVYFRYPGHESVPLVPSSLGDIPQGWEVKRLDQVCRSIQDGDWIETKDQGGEDFRLLQISNVGIGEFIETGNRRFITHETYSRLRCNEIIPEDLLVARMPTPIGRGWLATKMPWRMITSVDVAIIRVERVVVQPIFLAQAWNETSNLQRIAVQASGTTRLRITRRELEALEFVIPTQAVQQRFADIVHSQRTLIETLKQQIQNLRATRDTLLPRLLSGQIEVEVVVS